ncbi:hypothetical protein [Nonomuraea sp. NPDC049709]|uniref:hypothetical protein n=1 Tax=Nonomuraea sp. NPDC049709 TaxID=3154736 RepID=UPI003435B06B
MGSALIDGDPQRIGGFWLAGRLTRLPTALEPLIAAVCARAGRGLTEAEWRRYLPGRTYEPACRAAP